MEFVEKTLAKPREDLIILENAELNGQERASIWGDPINNGVFIFENNPLYPGMLKHFISAYSVTDNAFNYLVEKNKLGVNPAKKQEWALKHQETLEKIAQKKENRHLFHQTLPKDALVSNKQIQQAYDLNENLKRNPTLQSELTDSQKNILK